MAPTCSQRNSYYEPTCTNTRYNHDSGYDNNNSYTYYTYYDIQGDLEGTSTFKWYRYPQGGSLTDTDSTRQSYVLSEDDLTYYIQAEVTPHAVSGSTPGNAAIINTGPVLAWAIRTKAGGYVRTKSNELIKTR